MSKKSKNTKSTTKHPLSGIRVLVGRAHHQAGALSGQLRKLGAEVIEIPFIEIRKPRSFKPLDEALKNLARYEWLILTSVNGVEALWERMQHLHLTKHALSHLRVAAIGPATRKAIENLGISVDVVPKEYVAESVVRSLKRKVKGKGVLLVRARVARDVIPRELRKVGARVHVVEAYETVVPQSSRKRVRATLRSPLQRPHVVTFTSSSTVRNFVTLLGSSAKTLWQRKSQSSIRTASIGPVTSSTLRELGLPVDIQAREFTIPGLVTAIERAASVLRSWQTVGKR